jgi:putative glutamine amidotransferase
MKPIIGIITRPGKSKVGHDTMLVYKQVSDVVIKFGGIPIGVIPPIIDELYDKTIDNTKAMTEKEYTEYKRILDLCDGIICQGGDDYYDYDIKAIKYAYDIDKPLLGICLGMQTMGALFNGYIEDMDTKFHLQKHAEYVHLVKLKKDSILSKVYHQDYVYTNSRHKSMVVKTNLDIVGYSDDGIIEAIEDPTKKFFIGVQWHPESMIEYDILTNRLFTYFIDKCK